MKKAKVSVIVDKAPAKKHRGRPKKVQSNPSVSTAQSKTAGTIPEKRHRGRPKKIQQTPSETAVTKPAKKRGRPKKQKDKVVSFNVYSDYLDDIDAVKANVDMLIQSFSVLLDIQDYLEKQIKNAK